MAQGIGPLHGEKIMHVFKTLDIRGLSFFSASEQTSKAFKAMIHGNESKTHENRTGPARLGHLGVFAQESTKDAGEETEFLKLSITGVLRGTNQRRTTPVPISRSCRLRFG